MSIIYIREQGQLVPLDIPEYKGDRGEAGQTPDLQVGNVTALPNGQQASVTIQGDKENPTINIGIPSGEIGDKGLYVGRPEDAYDETKVVFDDENWIDDTYFENSTVDYMGGEHKSLKEKSDSDVEYILRKFGTQHYEGTNITATDTYAKQVKSAMFKGQTLVNLISGYQLPSNANVFTTYENGVYTYQSTQNYSGAITPANVLELLTLSSKLELNKTYTLFVTQLSDSGCQFGVETRNKDGVTLDRVLETISHNGMIRKFAFRLTREYVTLWLRLQLYNSTERSIQFKDIMVLEGDYTNQDIPYFEGMKSVKSPMLTVTNADSTKSHTLTTPSDLELRSNENVYDELDLITGKLRQRIGEDGSVLTQPIIKTIDLNNQKIYSYDGTTHYITSSLQGHPNPILSIDVPTNITSLLKHQQNTINQQRLVLSEREEMQNILIESMLYRYEQSTLLNDTIEVVPNYIQKLYEVAYQRGIRFRKEE